MFHEHAQRHVIGEDGLSSTGGIVGMVGDRGIEHGQEESGLRLELVAADVARHREAVGHDKLRIVLRGFQEVAEVHMLLLVVVAVLLPGRNGLPVEHDDVEESVQQQDGVHTDTARIQQHRGGRPRLQRVAHERGLDHDKAIGDTLAVQNVSIVGLLVR